MKAEDIIKILIEKKNYDRNQTERLAPKIDALPEDIKNALVKWVKDGTLSSPEYNGYTAEKILKAKPGMTVLGAFLSLDWIRKDPKTAIKAILTPVMKFTSNPQPDVRLL